MDKKSISELRRRLKKDTCTFTKMTGCYVDDNKNKVLNIDEIFLNLEDEEYFKFLEIAKKILSTNLGNNILELEFPLKEEEPGGHQQFLLALKKSELKDEALVERFYDLIIEKYDALGNYLILLFHDRYDVMVKTSDNNYIDESEEVYEYIICAICPMILSKPGLGYNKQDNKISTLTREWMVGMPETGFVFPAFNDRSSDIHSVLMYTADAENVHTELIQDVLGCQEKLTFAQKQNVLSDMVGEVVDVDSLKDIMTSVNIELAQICDAEPEEVVSKENIKSALEYAGVSENNALKIGEKYVEEMVDELPLVSDIVPNKAAKVVKDNNEKELLKEEVKELNRRIANITEGGGDIIITVNSDKKEMIRREYIDGQSCVIIPVADNENVKIN